jgi:hypothetical protein
MSIESAKDDRVENVWVCEDRELAGRKHVNIGVMKSWRIRTTRDDHAGGGFGQECVGARTNPVSKTVMAVGQRGSC